MKERLEFIITLVPQCQSACRGVCVSMKDNDRALMLKGPQGLKYDIRSDIDQL